LKIKVSIDIYERCVYRSVIPNLNFCILLLFHNVCTDQKYTNKFKNQQYSFHSDLLILLIVHINLCTFLTLAAMLVLYLFVSNGFKTYSLENLQLPGPICIAMNACKIAANATGSNESIAGMLSQTVPTMSFFTAYVSMSMVCVQFDWCNFLTLTSAAMFALELFVSNGMHSYSLQNLQLPGPICIVMNACKIAANATGSNESIAGTCMLLQIFDALHTMLLIKGTCKFFQQLKKNIIARWQIIEWTNSSITYMCLILFVICAETYSMLMPGIFSDTFSKFVHLVLSFVILTMWFAMWCAVLNLLMNRHRRRGCCGPIQCRGVGSMVRQCICKLDFAIGKLIRMLQKKATYVVLVNWMATWCGFKKWWVEENPTTLKKTKLTPTNHGIQRKKTRKKSYRTGFSSLLVLVGVLSMVGMMFGAANACSGSTNPPICDPLPNGNGVGSPAASRAGSLGGVVDDLYQDYQGGIGNKPVGSMSTAEAIAKHGPIDTWDTSQVTNMRYVFYGKKNINPDIRKWRVESVVDMKSMFQSTNSFNIDLSGWIVSSVTTMRQMFYKATAYTQVLCGNTWVESTASKTSMFDEAGSNAKIATVPCLYNTCSPGKYLTITTPKTCTNCPNGQYQDKLGFKGSACTECSVENIVSISKGSCTVLGYDPLPNGNGNHIAADRVGSLGGVVDDLYQEYHNGGGNTVSKPAGSMSTAEAIAKHGPIDTWDTSQVTNMKYVFVNKKNINPDIRNWRVDSVVNMNGMIQATDSFNIDLSGWIVSSVTDMNYMFYDATAYTQILCGNTWIESTASKSDMFKDAGSGAKIATEPCHCSPGKYLTTTTPKTCTYCPNGKYQDVQEFTGSSCTKTCGSTHICCIISTGSTTCDSLPNGNGKYWAASRAGSLGGVVDDFFQDYRDGNGNTVSKPTSSMSTAHAIAKYGPIETWDTSKVTNMAILFIHKKGINPDIRKWRVDSVEHMDYMFAYTDSFNIDLSGWIVSSVTNMGDMFKYATAYTQVLCGKTWIESTASKDRMFTDAGSGAKIGDETCACPVGKSLTASLTCIDCTSGKYQDNPVFTESSCTKECSAGKYSINGASSCDFEIDSCPEGTYSNEPASCISCVAGRYSTAGNAQTSTSVCKACISGRYSISGEKQTSIDVCLACAAGRYSTIGEGQTSSVVECANKCSSGKWSDQTGLISDNDCTACTAGRYSIAEIGQNSSTACTTCSAGKWSSKTGLTSDDCTVCSGGKFSNTTGLSSDSECTECRANTFIADSGGSNGDVQKHDDGEDCLSCEEGTYSKPGSQYCSSCIAGTFRKITSTKTTCEPCISGMYQDKVNADKCDACPLGWYQKDAAKQFCLPCIPGKYQNTEKQDSCFDCENGRYQPGANATKCIQLDSNNIAPKGSAAAVEVPSGSYLTDCKGDTCRGFLSCPQGWKGNDEKREKKCSKCPAGQSSFKGSTECRTCAKGKFSNVEKSASCNYCPSGFYQPSDIEAKDALECTKCPTGFAQKKTGSAVCISNGGKTPEDCKDNEYFNASKMYDTDKPLGDCLDCPEGASCKGAIDETGVRALFGWSECLNVNLTYERCSFGAACLGAKYVLFFSFKFYNKNY
jgi:surface protein